MSPGNDLHDYFQHAIQTAAKTAAAHQGGMHAGAMALLLPELPEAEAALAAGLGALLGAAIVHEAMPSPAGRGDSPAAPVPTPGQIAAEAQRGGVHGAQREGFDAHGPAGGQGRETYGPPMAPAGQAPATTPGDILREDERFEVHGPEQSRAGQVLTQDKPPGGGGYGERPDGKPWVEALGLKPKGDAGGGAEKGADRTTDAQSPPVAQPPAPAPGEILRGEEPAPGGFAERVLKAREGNQGGDADSSQLPRGKVLPDDQMPHDKGRDR